MIFDSFVHHTKPNWRYSGQQHHSWVSGGHLWAVVHVSEYLILAAGDIVMIRMPGELKEHDSAYNMVRVPGMSRHDPFVLLTFLVSAEAIVLDIVDRFE